MAFASAWQDIPFNVAISMASFLLDSVVRTDHAARSHRSFAARCSCRGSFAEVDTENTEKLPYSTVQGTAMGQDLQRPKLQKGLKYTAAAPEPKQQLTNAARPSGLAKTRNRLRAADQDCKFVWPPLGGV